MKVVYRFENTINKIFNNTFSKYVKLSLIRKSCTSAFDLRHAFSFINEGIKLVNMSNIFNDTSSKYVKLSLVRKSSMNMSAFDLRHVFGFICF